MHEIQIKAPATPAEFASMWRLNHAVFAEELHQHPCRDDQSLVDKFHGKNRYRIAWDGSRAVGMICAHGEAPFSVVGHFGAAAACWIQSGVTAEIRLFALLPEFRAGVWPARLAMPLLAELRDCGFQRLMITGIASRRGLYEHLGFRAVGGAVRDGASEFYPMTAELDRVLARCERVMRNFA